MKKIIASKYSAGKLGAKYVAALSLITGLELCFPFNNLTPFS
jgi:hypothetical protein